MKTEPFQQIFEKYSDIKFHEHLTIRSRVFLLQRLKGSMSGDARDFNNIETRAVIKFLFFFFVRDKAPKEIQAILPETLGEHAPSYATVKNWVAQLNVVIFSPVLRYVLNDSKQ